MIERICPLPNTEHADDEPCASCVEGYVPGQAQCPHSKYRCGHHCDCSWVVDVCCRCGMEWGPED